MTKSQASRPCASWRLAPAVTTLSLGAWILSDQSSDSSAFTYVKSVSRSIADSDNDVTESKSTMVGKVFLTIQSRAPTEHGNSNRSRLAISRISLYILGIRRPPSFLYTQCARRIDIGAVPAKSVKTGLEPDDMIITILRRREIPQSFLVIFIPSPNCALARSERPICISRDGISARQLLRRPRNHSTMRPLSAIRSPDTRPASSPSVAFGLGLLSKKRRTQLPTWPVQPW
ncbi:hypothetical protein BU26DRAFT_101077 [Trematosphaeria pertusa]|uniref:Uncharacterized protein n=1 Tax=Trematosphaeria pertusa TaxID=390896 RepID=A0A6A6I2A1_9PLEO|nr:uncharacterized protein BU26DRAFT_101077 [Trematosphaeria pertusa]KAF2244416.1 hypothetical protein BU26DRAFT_101077 [Trematosphaeria pertusa]